MLLPAFGVLLLLNACDLPKKTAATGDDGEIQVTILQMNDVYEISPLSDGTGGMARVAALRQELLAKNPNTLTVLAGDFISPSVIGTLKHEGNRIRGRQMVDVMNTLGVDYVTFGNHEFDYDYADLQDRINESRFTWICSNARYVEKEGAAPVPFFKMTAEGKQNLPDESVVTLKDSDGTTLRLGLLGVCINTGRKPWVTYGDWFDAAQKSYEKLRPQTDVCVAITHLSVGDDIKLAGMLPNVPLIMGGHEHENQIHPVGKSVVAKADANAKTVYIHQLTYNTRTKTAKVTSSLRVIDGKLPEEPNTAATVAKWEKIKKEALNSAGFEPDRLVVTLKSPLDCRETSIRRQQMPVGEMVNKAMMASAQNAPECAFFNSGSIRVDDVLTGNITELDIVRMLPFGGGFSEVDIKGSLLLQALEAGAKNEFNGGYLQLWNITKTPAGGWVVSGKPLESTKVYRVVMPDFLLTGNEQNMSFLKAKPVDDKGSTDNPNILTILRPSDSKNKADLRNDIRLALIQYMHSM